MRTYTTNGNGKNGGYMSYRSDMDGSDGQRENNYNGGGGGGNY